MTREEKIAKIYEKIADKTLSFGCKLGNGHLSYKGIFISLKKQPGGNGWFFFQIDNDGCSVPVIELDTLYDEQWITKIGHPVMIGDVLDFIYSDVTIISGTIVQRRKLGESIIKNWKYKRKPLEEQSEECIEYIYNLLPKKVTYV